LGSHLAWLQEHAGQQQELHGHATMQPCAAAPAAPVPEQIAQLTSTSDRPSTAPDVAVDSVLRFEEPQAMSDSSRSSSDGKLPGRVFYEA
jgi:hypothetical protein